MKLYTFLAACILLAACTDTKEQEKNALNDVIKIHDEAMANDEQAVKNKMLLDSLTKTTPAIDTAKINLVIKDLAAADKAMEDWMHQFNADNTGKSHDEIMQYLADQKKKVGEVNKHLNSTVNQSNQLISTLKK